MKQVLYNKKAWAVRFISLLSTLLLSSLLAISQNTENTAARRYASDFFAIRQQDKPMLKSTASAAVLTQCYQSPENVKTPLFVFQQEGIGFAMIAQSHNTFKVVGYSDEGSFQPENIPPQLQALMNYYEDSLQFINPISKPLRAGNPIVPALLYEHGIKLNQFHHPEVGGSYTGCMATAITQIMLFHAAEQNKQIKGYGSHCYTYGNYGEICADFENTTYNSQQLLSYHVAIALDMRFTTGGSSPPNNAVIGNIEKYFHYFVKNGISENFYIKNELEHRRPVYAAIIGYPENHAVVIDGYDNCDYFHLNFGWGGHFNGYFSMNNGSWLGTGSGGQKFFTNFSSIAVLSPNQTPVNKQDSLALVAIHNALGGYEVTKWDLTKSVWSWPGVVVMNDRVIRLTVSSSIPPKTAQSIAPEIGNLTALQELFIGGCLNGTIPSTITNLTDLKKINLSNSYVYVYPTLHKGNFKSALPADIGKLTKLEWLSISGALEGTIPASIGNLSNMKLLRLYQDTTYYGKGNITGTIPVEIGNLSKLQQLHISNQKLTGNFPATIGNLTELNDITLSGNRLIGNIPVLNLPNLAYLKLDDNLFSELADGNWSCPRLINIELQNNQITGSIPFWLGNFSALKSLNLYNNQITSIPEEVGNLIQLASLEIGNNQLKVLPDGLALNLNLQYLEASNNQIAFIPSNFGQSQLLATLNLSNNQIKTIPEQIGNCPDLYEINLSNNKIESIPASFANIRDAATVNLENNEIQGSIPEKIMRMQSTRLYGNRFIFKDIPKSEKLICGARNQKNVLVKKQLYNVQIGDTLTIDVREITRLSDPDNEYFWFCYPNNILKDEPTNPVLKVIINELTLKNKYYCKVFNPKVPTFTLPDDPNYKILCLEGLNTDTIAFKLITEEEKIAEKYPGEFVTSLKAISNKTISDGTVTLVPPQKIKRGVVQWEASADGVTWEKVSAQMQHADLKANVKSVSNDKLVLTPRNTAFYRCSLQETNCDPIYSDKLKVKALGNVLFDGIINVKEDSRTISVDSIEVLVPIHFHDEDFRLIITKIDNPPAVPVSVIAGSAYDVKVSFADEFVVPLLVKLKNFDKTKIKDKEIDLWKAVYFDDENQDWKPFEHAHISIKDSTIGFTTNHLTKLSWFWDNNDMNNGYTDVYERNNIRVFYKDGDTDFMKYGYAKKQSAQAWHVAGIPILVQDITEYLPKVIAKYKSLELSVPDGKFKVYIKEMDDAGCVGIMGMLDGYLLISRNMLTPVELRQVLAHEYMHYTQDYYISANPSNSFWMEAHATLSDRIVWDDKEVPKCEPEELLESGKTSKISIFNFLSNSWDYWDMSFLTNNLAGNIHYNYLAGNFLHYLRSYRDGDKKLKPATLLKETSWFGSWRTYLASYTSNHLDAILGDEYEEYVKFLLSGENENFTLINKKGNPYAYLQDPKNKGAFTHPVTYRFKEGDEMVQNDDMNITVPYMAAKIVLLENICPDTMVLVNYKRKHEFDYNHMVYHVSYDFEKKQMTYVDISDSTEYNFLLENRNKENTLTKFNNYSFLLLINKEYIGASSLIKDFDASFELTAMPILNIESVGMLTIYNGNTPMTHSFGDQQDYIMIGSPNADWLQKVTEFDVRMTDKNTSKQILNEHTLQIITQFALIIDQGQIKGMPTMKDSTSYTQIIDYDVIIGTMKITEQEQKFHKLHTFIEFTDGDNGDVEERIVWLGYKDILEEKTKTYWLNNFMNYLQPESATKDFQEVYGQNIKMFKTNNTAETQQVVTKIDANYKTTNFNQKGEVSSTVESTYSSTDFSNLNLKLNFIVRTAEY